MLISINEECMILRPCNYDLNMIGINNVPMFPIVFTIDCKRFRKWKPTIRRNVDFLMHFLHVRFPPSFGWMDHFMDEEYIGL